MSDQILAQDSPAADPAERAPRRDREPLWRHMLGARLRSIRHDRDETLAVTARRAGVSIQYLSEVERGTKEPSSEVIAAVVGALDTTLLDLTAEVADDLRAARAAAAIGATCRAEVALAA